MNNFSLLRGILFLSQGKQTGIIYIDGISEDTHNSWGHLQPMRLLSTIKIPATNKIPLLIGNTEFHLLVLICKLKNKLKLSFPSMSWHNTWVKLSLSIDVTKFSNSANCVCYPQITNSQTIWLFNLLGSVFLLCTERNKCLQVRNFSCI